MVPATIWVFVFKHCMASIQGARDIKRRKAILEVCTPVEEPAPGSEPAVPQVLDQQAQ